MLPGGNEVWDIQSLQTGSYIRKPGRNLKKISFNPVPLLRNPSHKIGTKPSVL